MIIMVVASEIEGYSKLLMILNSLLFLLCKIISIKNNNLMIFLMSGIKVCVNVTIAVIVKKTSFQINVYSALIQHSIFIRDNFILHFVKLCVNETIVQ